MAIKTTPLWECLGCGYRVQRPSVGCKGHCRDESGRNCDAFACPKCLRVHYWTSHIKDGWHDSF